MGRQKRFVSDSEGHECSLWVRRVVLHPTLCFHSDSCEVGCLCASFVWGASPGVSSGFDIETRDREAMHACNGIVVASAIFGEGSLSRAT